MSYYEDAARQQAENDSQVRDHIRRGEYGKAARRIWEIIKGIVSDVDTIIKIVRFVCRIFGIDPLV